MSRVAIHAPKAGFAALKEKIVDAGESSQTRGSHDDLDRHFEALRVEFSGQSALLLEHARLNVLCDVRSLQKKPMHGWWSFTA